MSDSTVLKRKPYGVALIGCGYIGAQHIESLYYRDEVHIAAVADLNEQATILFSKKYGAPFWSTDYRDIVFRDDVDIVIVATNVVSHAPILKACIQAGKHVLCEKPVAASLEESLHCLELARCAESRVLFGHVLRHSQTYQRAAVLVSSGELGRLRVMRMSHSHHALDWDRYRALLADCPPIVDCGVHYIDVAQWFADSRVVQVGGVAGALDHDLPHGRYNYGLMTMTLQDETVAYFEAGWSPNISCENIKQFIGDGGYLSITMGSDRPFMHEEGDLIRLYQRNGSQYTDINLRSCNTKNLYAQFRVLVNMIENGGVADPSLDSVESATRVAFAADRALREGRVIHLDPETQRELD